MKKWRRKVQGYKRGRLKRGKKWKWCWGAGMDGWIGVGRGLEKSGGIEKKSAGV